MPEDVTTLQVVLTADPALIAIVRLSLMVSLSAVFVAALIGVPLGAVLALTRFPGREAINVVLNAMMGLPPVVVGLAVYLLLSRSGPLGAWGLLFTPTAMIVAQTILVLPIIGALTRQSVEDLWAEYRDELAAMNIGGEDFALETGMEPSEATLLMPKQQMIFAARAAGIMPLGFIDSLASFADLDAFAQMVQRSRRFGFMGAGCIHPGQVPIVNQYYSPSPEDVAYAARIIEGNAAHAAAGRGSWSLDGKMIDVPVVVRAERLLERHAAIMARTGHPTDRRQP